MLYHFAAITCKVCYSNITGVMLKLLVLILFVSIVAAVHLDSRRKLTPRLIRLRCCDNNWSCCKAYPWEGPGRQDADKDTDMEDEDGSASGNYSGSGEMNYSPECKKYNTIRVNDHFGDRCINNYYLFRDLRRVRNIVSLLYKCSRRKDPEFYAALMKIDSDVRNGGNACCVKHSLEGLLGTVAHYVSVLGKEMDELQKHFNLHESLASNPHCYLYGHYVSVERKLSDAIYEMGFYILCAEEAACSTLNV